MRLEFELQENSNNQNLDARFIRARSTLDVHLRSRPSVRHRPDQAGTMLHLCIATLVEDDLATSLC
jgi:hypothetical protein